MTLPEELVRQIHATSGRSSSRSTGGAGPGRAAGDAGRVQDPAGSRPCPTPRALAAWLGSRPEQSCSSRTARAMAVVAFGRAIRYGAAEDRRPAWPAPPDWRPIGPNAAPSRPRRLADRRPDAALVAGTEKAPAVARKRNKSSAAWCSTRWPRPAAWPSGWTCRCWSRNGSRSAVAAPPKWQDCFLGRDARRIPPPPRTTSDGKRLRPSPLKGGPTTA